MLRWILASIALMLTGSLGAETYLYVADHNTGKVIKIKPDGTLLWDVPNGNGHDVQSWPTSNVLIIHGTSSQEVAPGQESRLGGRQARRAPRPNRCSAWPTAIRSSPTTAG